LGKSPIGLILVVGAVIAGGWCFMAGPCKKWLDDLGKGNPLADIESAVGGILNPTGHGTTQAVLTDNLNKSVANLPKTLTPGGPNIPLTGVFDIKNGKVVGPSTNQKVSQSQSSFTQAYMGHLSYW
jgi:hypothetical protein